MTKTKQELQTENNRDFAARLMAVQAYYQMSQNEQSLRNVLNEYVDHRKEIKTVEDEILGKANTTLFKEIMIDLDVRRAEVIEILKGHLQREGDEPKEVEPLLGSILVCGVSEILNQKNKDISLIINDYLNVCHSFYAQGQVSFVNGILDSVAKLLRQ